MLISPHTAAWCFGNRRSGPCVEDTVALTKDKKTELIGDVQDPRQRHRLAGSAGRHPERAHHLPDRALQDARQGPPLAPRPAEARRPAPAPARLPEEQGPEPAISGRHHQERLGIRKSSGSTTAARGRHSSDSHAYQQCTRASCSAIGLADPCRSRPAAWPSRPTARSIVRLGDTMVLVHGLPLAQPARGHRLPAAHGGLPRVHLRVGAHSRRLLQARRQGDREGNADEPRHRPAASVRCSRRAGTTRRRSSPWCCPPTPRTIRDVLAITGASAALALSEIPFEKTIAGVRVGLVDGQYIINPTFAQRTPEPPRPHRRRQQGRHRDGRSRRQARCPKTRPSRRSKPAHAAIKQIVRRDRRPARKAAGKREAAQARGEGRTRRSTRRSRRRRSAPLTEAMRIKGKLENYATRGPGARRRRSSPRLPEDRGQRRKGDAKAHLQGPEGEGPARRDPRARRAPRRPQVRRDPADHDRGRRAAAHPRLGACSRAARRRRSSPPRSARPTTSRRSRWSTARRTSASCSTTTSRRSRSVK